MAGMIERRRLLVSLGVLLGAGIIGVYFTPNPNALPAGGPFSLESAAGPVTRDSLRGRVVLVYFGYASCPDVCPVMLGLVGTALRLLPAGEVDKVRVVFVSLDPERDTPASLAAYATHFHPNVIGTTAAEAVLRDVAGRYGVTWRMHGVESALGYVVDHTSQLAVLGPNGALVEVLPDGTSPEEITAAILRHSATATAAAVAPAAPPTPASEAVRVTDAYVRAPPPGARVTAAYLTLTNTTGAPHALVRAESPAAEAVELHAVLTENGLTSMRPVPRFDVPPNGETKLAPSGAHIMIIGVKGPLDAGATFPLTLTYADGATVTLDVPVRAD